MGGHARSGQHHADAMRVIATAALLAAATSCAKYELTRLHTIDVARAIPPCVDESDLQMAASEPPVPMVCYAYVDTANQDAAGLSGMISRAVDKDGIPDPDYVVLWEGGSQYAGSTTTYLGFGLFNSSANYVTPQRLFLMRRTPSIVGVVYDDDFMIIELEEAARKSGIQEGDKLVSINGHAVARQDGQLVTEWDTARLSMDPGEPVDLVWIRPGEGRMSGSCVSIEPRPVPQGGVNLYVRFNESQRRLRAARRERARG